MGFSSAFHIEKKLMQTKWAFLLFIVGLIAYLNLSDPSFILQNVLFLPVLGALGYAYTKKLFIVPSISTLVLFITFMIKDCILSQFDLFSSVLYGFFYFLFILIGSIILFIFMRANKNFRSKSSKQKFGIILANIFACCITLALLITHNELNGNAFSAIHAEARMQEYIKTNYPTDDISLHSPTYGFKFSSYTADAYLHNEKESKPFNIFYKNGNIWDDYYEHYTEDMKNSYRLSEEARLSIQELLDQANLPYDYVDVAISVPKDTYDQTAFSNDLAFNTFDITICNYTTTKEEYATFTTWCDSIRALLLEQGYNHSNLYLESDPHALANRLSLSFTPAQLSIPITDVTKLKSFTDYGSLNHITTSSSLSIIEKEAEGDLMYSQHQTDKLTARAKAAGLPLEVIEVSSNKTSVSYNIIGFGNRISLDTYAEQLISIKDFLISQATSSKLTLSDFSYRYYWGTSYEGYDFSCYGEEIYDITTDSILDYFFTHE